MLDLEQNQEREQEREQERDQEKFYSIKQMNYLVSMNFYIQTNS
jgi:hypothetical protein